MDIDHHNGRARAQLGEARVGATKRVVDGRHKSAPHQIQHPDRNAVYIESSCAAPWYAWWVVSRTNDALATLDILSKLALVKNMIAAGDKIDAAGEHLIGGRRSQAEAARRVFTIGDACVHVVLFAQQRNAALKHLTTRRSNNIANDEDIEGGAFYRRADAFAFFWDFKK